MSEQKKYIFTSDCTNLAGALLFSEGDIITVGAMLTDQERRNLIESGVLIDYPEPSMVSDDLTGVELKTACDKVEALEKELNDLKKKLTAAKKAKTKAQKDGDKVFRAVSSELDKCLNKCAELESKKRKIADELHSKQGVIECQYNDIKKKDETILKLYSEKHNNWVLNEVAKDTATSKEIHVLSDGKGGIVKTKDPADYYRQCYKAEQERSLILKKRINTKERFKTKKAYTKKDMLQVCIILSTVSSIVSASLIVCFMFHNI